MWVRLRSKRKKETPMSKPRWLFLVLCVGVSVALLVLSLAAYLPAPPTVIVSVHATDSSGHPLHYRWRATDGKITDVDAASTIWTLPNGPGLHFAYVLVFNGVGGYTERRVAVNTDTIGTPPKNPPPLTLAAPPAPAQHGDYYRSFVPWGGHTVNSHFRQVYSPNLQAYQQDLSSGARYPATKNVLSNTRGEVVIPGVPPGNQYQLDCSVDGGKTFSNCTSSALMLPAATSDYILGGPGSGAYSGSFLLQDGNPCGTVNEFFGTKVTATATMLDAANKTLAGPVAVNELGDYSLPQVANAASVVLHCEGAHPVVISIPGSGDLGQTLLTGVSAPKVISMSATLNGSQVGLFLPPPSGLPSDILTRVNGFLAEKGVDSSIGACQYYKADGAVKGCDSKGNLLGAISFEDWKRMVKIDTYAGSGATEYSATYINKADLNLTRNHHSISYASDNTAAYVCNHLGPPFSLVTPQAEVDTAIDNTVNGKNLVACVAMDYAVHPGVNNGKPFIRFLIFGPSGQLLPSVNLDGRREKYVPGTCVVCHGGDHYAGKFPEDGSGFANVGGHFLPYDTGNFEFSNKAGLTEADQEDAIYNLNQNVLNAGPTPAERALIAGWYAHGRVLDKLYVPQSFRDAQKAYSIASISSTGDQVTVKTSSPNPFVTNQVVTIAGVSNPKFNGAFYIRVLSSNQFTYSATMPDAISSGGTASSNPTAVSFYRDVLARSCRGCHVAMFGTFNFDVYQNIAPGASTDRFADAGFDVESNVCGGSSQVVRDHMMPNSLVTFNRFWLTYKNKVGLPDQPTVLTRFFGPDTGNAGACVPGIAP